jgi:hypothetical protein
VYGICKRCGGCGCMVYVRGVADVGVYNVRLV